MKFTTLIIAFLISLTTFSQGLNGEIALNEFYRQKSDAVAVVDEYSYFASQQNVSGLFITCDLYKVDTLGNIVWSSPITPQTVEYIEVHEIIPSEDGGVYISGHARPGCDYGDDNFDFLQKYNANGGLIWTRSFPDTDNYYIKTTGLSLSGNNEVFISKSTTNESKIYTLSSSGLFLDSLSTNETYFEKIFNFTGFNKIAHNEDSIFGFDNNGNTITSVNFSSKITDIEVFNDTLYALTSDSIFSFDINFQIVESTNIAGYTGYSKLKVNDQKIEFLSQGMNDQTILSLDRQLTLNDVLTIPVSLDADEPKDFNDLHFATTINFELTKYTSIRHLDFSRQSTQDVGINTTDIGIIDIQQTQVQAQPIQGAPGVYDIKLWADVLIKNYGNKTLDNCRINHRIAQSICGDAYYSERFTNLNLAPNDSMWVSLGYMHNNYGSSNSGAIIQEICVYTSHPNMKTDLNVPNDNYCEDIIFGYVGLNENEIPEVNIYPNPTNSFLNIEIEQKNIDYKIYSMQGVLINEGDLHSKQIDVSKLSTGMYVLQLNAKDGILNFRKQFLKN